MLTPDARLARIAERQYGVFTYTQSLDCGFTPKTIAYRIRIGRWRRLHRGVYALVGTPTSFAQHARAAVFAGGPAALASHRTAGELFQLEDIDGGTIEIITGLGRRARLSGVRVHQSRTLARTDRARIVGIPVTTPARALIDLASVSTRTRSKTRFMTPSAASSCGREHYRDGWSECRAEVRLERASSFTSFATQ